MRAKFSVYFDYFDDKLAPIWMVIKFTTPIDWDREYIYIPVTLPFHRCMAEDFDDQVIGISIAQTELVISVDRPNQFGIHIPTVKQRLNKLRGEKFAPQFMMSDIEQFVIQISDIEEVLQMNVNSVFNYR